GPARSMSIAATSTPGAGTSTTSSPLGVGDATLTCAGNPTPKRKLVNVAAARWRIGGLLLRERGSKRGPDHPIGVRQPQWPTPRRTVPTSDPAGPPIDAAAVPREHRRPLARADPWEISRSSPS